MGLDLPAPRVSPPPGDRPLVLIAPSTVKDPGGRLTAAALAALGDEPLRILASTSGGAAPPRVPSNAVVAEWLDYTAAMSEASLVICHGNHGTVVQALAAGVPVLVVPALADDAEHGARVTWCGGGLMVPRRLCTPATLRLAARRVLEEPRFTARAARIAAANRGRDGGPIAATLVESHAREAAR
jgi:UDP:flavonoid glycosyltransferase YjiC (YdhE family)